MYSGHNNARSQIDQAEKEQEIIERGFSPAFDRLVEHPEDFVGMIAYSVYKTIKRQMISDNRYERDHPDVKHYYKHHLTTEQVKLLRSNAEVRLDEYVNTIINRGLINNALDVGVTKLHEALSTDLRKRTGFWRAVGANILSATLMAVILAGVAIALWQAPISPYVLHLELYPGEIAPASGPQRR